MVNADQVQPGIWIGDEDSDNYGNFLTNRKIKGILVVRTGSDSHAKLAKDVEYRKLSIEDHPYENIGRFFDQTNDFIARNLKRGGVLVRCQAGISRSVTIVIAYLVKTKGWSVDRALAEIRRKRPIANPNPGFMDQLYAYEHYLRTAKLRQR